MDAFNTQSRDNLGSILPMSQNLPLKEDLELLPKATHKSSVKLIGRLAVLAVGVSTFSLVSNEVSFYHFSSFYNFISTFTSLASLIISSLLIFWTTKTLNQEQSNTETVPTRRWELFSQGLYTTLIFRAAISLPLIANMLFQGDNTSHHLRALEATYNDETVASTEFALRSIGTVLPFLEVLLSLIFVQAARTVFPYIREQSSTMTRMVFIGSAALMASSFGMLYALRYASDYQDLYNQPFPSWNIGGLVFFGIASAIISGLVWTVNHTKWRAPFTIVAGVLAALTLGLAIFSSLSYTNSQSIAGYYGDMKNLDTWSEQMAATNKADLRTVGCPSKYLPKYIAKDPSFDTLWGPGATTKDGLPTKYLNLACIELLGSQQASYFAEATTYGLLTVVSGLIILIGFLYFNHTQWREVGERNKKDYRWLVVLGAIVLAFNVAMIMYDAPLPSENAKLAINSNNYIYLADDATTATADATTATAADDSAAAATAAPTDATPAAPVSSSGSTAPSTSITVSDRYKTAFSDLVNKNYRFMIFKHDRTIARQINIEAGLWDWTFLDFANAFYPGEEQVGFIMLGDEGKERPYMIVFAPENTPAKDVLDGFGLPYNTQDYQRAGLTDATNYVVRSKKELDLNSILADSQSGIVAIFADDATTATADATPAAADATPPPVAPAPAAAATPAAAQDTTNSPYQAAFNDLTSKKLRFIILYRDSTIPNKVNIVAGPWNWEFIDFSNAFFAVEHQVGFVMLGEEGKEKPYFIVYAPGGAPVKEILDEFDLPYTTDDLEAQGLSNVKYFVANTKKQLDEQNIYNQSESGTLVAADSTLILATSLNNVYNQTFQDLIKGRSRFVIFRHDVKDPMQINLTVGSPQAIFNDFSSIFDAGREQAGIIYLGSGTSLRPYLVVLAPGNKNAANVLSGFNLPIYSSDYEKLGFKNINYYVAKDRRNITLTNVVMNAKVGGTINLFQDAALALASDDKPFASIYNAINHKKYRYVVLKHDPRDPMNVKVVPGAWDSLFSDFNDTFTAGEEQVGIINLGPKGEESPYIVVFGPHNTTAAEILEGFGLPYTTQGFEDAGLPGANYYAIDSLQDLELSKVVVGSKAGQITTLAEFEEGQWEPAEPAENGGDADIFASSDANIYASLFQNLNNKDIRFAILRNDPNNPMNVKVAAAPWKWTFNDFVANINSTIDQVGFITLGPKGGEKPYMIVFTPSSTTTAKSVLNNLNLPTSTDDLQRAGLSGASYFIAHKVSDLDLNTIVMQSKAGSVGILFEDEEETDEEGSQQDQGDSEQSDENSGDYDNGNYENNNYEDSLTSTDDSTIAGDSTITGDTSVFQETQNTPYAGIFNGLNNKKYRFVVLKHDPNDPMNVKITGGPWNLNFQNFTDSIDQNREQVAFVYLGPANQEKLYRVVVAPSVLNSNAGRVVDSFQLPRDSKGLAQLGLKGVASYVAGSKSDITDQKIITYSKASVGNL